MSEHSQTKYVLSITPGQMVTVDDGTRLLQEGTREIQHLYMVLGKIVAAIPECFEGEFEAFTLGGQVHRSRMVQFPLDFDTFLRQQIRYLSTGNTLDFKYSGECIEFSVVVMAIPAIGGKFAYATRVHHLRYVEPTHATAR